MVLVANKVDLVHLRKITSEQGREMASKHSVSHLTHLTRERKSHFEFILTFSFVFPNCFKLFIFLYYYYIILL